MQGLFSSKISIDKITRFSVRSPELRELFHQVGNYYRWFIIINKRLGRERLENVLDDSIWNSLWVDGLQNQVCLRLKDLPEVIEFLELQDIPEDNQNSRYVMKTYFKKVSHYHNMFSENENYGSETDHELWAFMNNGILHDDDLRHLPIPVFSYVRPTMGPRFILHLMLSMGEFDTELDLILHRTLRDSLRYAKLIGLNDDEDSLQEYANSLLKKFILEQLQYFPNSSKVCGDWIVTASHLFESVILKDEIPITDMPPTHQTALNEFKDEEVLRMCSSMKEIS